MIDNLVKFRVIMSIVIKRNYKMCYKGKVDQNMKEKKGIIEKIEKKNGRKKHLNYKRKIKWIMTQ